MKIFAVICEYNPFHNGHLYQIEQMRASGASHILCIMSGNYVQRGEPAIMPKNIRAKSALKSGADLVVELPVAYALSTAERFAYGGVRLAQLLGGVDSLAFGAETNNLQELIEVTKLLKTTEFTTALEETLSTGITFAKARQEAVAKMGYKDLAQLLEQPNNILGISYLSHLMDTDINPLLIHRKGADHHSTTTVGSTASGSYLRAHWNEGNIGELVPPQAKELYSKAVEEGHYFLGGDYYDRMVLSHLRRLTLEELSQLPDISEGLEHRLFDSIKKACSLEELYSLVKTKRYTLARIRRIIICGYLGINSSYWNKDISHCKILGIGKGGGEILAKFKETSTIPISHSPSRLLEILPQERDSLLMEARATDLYNMMLKTPIKSTGIAGDRLDR